MQTKRGENPNSREALRKATEARKKDAVQVHVTLSPEAIAFYESLKNKLGKPRSWILEQLRYLDEDTLIELLAQSQQQDNKTEAILRFCSKVDQKVV